MSGEAQVRVELEPWHDFFLATAGAGSALAGLIIVAMSVNIGAILEIPSMTSRAGTTIATLILIVVVGCAALIPSQPLWALGVETVVVAGAGLLLAVLSAGHIFRAPTVKAGRWLNHGKAALGIVPTGGTLVAGAVMCFGVEAGLYVLSAAIITGFATATTNAWVLLVEIRR